MEDDLDNPLDDELLKELGLEPKVKPQAPPKQAVTRPPATAPVGSKSPPPPMQNQAAAPPRKADPPPAPKADTHFSEGVKNLSRDMPVQIVAVLGKKTMTLSEVIALKQGEMIDFNKLPQESIDLVANGKLVAKGELIVIDGKLGVQIKQLMG